MGLTKQEDIWSCYDCGNLQGRHDLWFEGDICEQCHALYNETNNAIVDYDSKQLVIKFNGEKFTFDLTLGDIGDFWHGFETKDGTKYDVSFHQEDADSFASVNVYGTIMEEDGELTIDSWNCEDIEVIDTMGNQENYFNN